MQSIILAHCWVCGEKTGLNDHHCVPQAYGGVDGPQVTLCANHHTLIHTVALRRQATWHVALGEGHTPQQAQKLGQLVTIIAKARAATAHIERPMQLQCKINTDRSRKLKELKRLLGKSSIPATVECLIDLVYAQCTQLKFQEGKTNVNKGLN